MNDKAAGQGPALHELVGAGSGAIPPAQAFGIIDPDYARVFTQARIVAWQYGYACLAHGTFTRDLDLLLVPWADHASREVDGIVKYLASVTGLKLQGPPSDKPHGRKAWTLLFPAFEDVRWVDVSAFAAPQVPDRLSERA